MHRFASNAGGFNANQQLSLHVIRRSSGLVAMLGLDLSAVEGYDGAMFEAIRQSCASCYFREACELDLRRDPNDPVWETYCPNSATLIALPEACWLGAR